MSKNIELKRRAGELREQAQAEWDEFKSQVSRQVSGENEGETRLTADEIAEKSAAIKAKLAEAKAVEGLDDLDGLMARTPQDGSSEANGMLKQIANALNNGGREDEKQEVWGKSINSFLRAIRTKHGNYDHPVQITDEQRKSLNMSRKLATLMHRGERMPTKRVSDNELKTMVGDDDQSASGGHFLVPAEHSAELLRVMAEQQQFIPRARRIPMARPTVDFPRLVQTEATDTRPMFSFAAVEKIAEGAEKPEREPKFEQLVLSAIKYAAYTEASDELLVDSIVPLEPVITGGLSAAIGYEYERDCIRGSGTGEPQGWLGSDAALTVNRQVADEIATTDVFNLEAQFFGDNGVYMYHPSAIPQLYGLSQDNIIVWNPNLADGVPGTLLGRPLVSTHKLPLLGATGDLSLVDPSFYLVGDLQAVTIANSVHFRFRNDVTAWRATFRGAGTPWPAAPFSHESDGTDMTYEVSPFVSLDADTVGT
jgi:HK97 family phage major capsid protein